MSLLCIPESMLRRADSLTVELLLMRPQISSAPCYFPIDAILHVLSTMKAKLHSLLFIQKPRAKAFRAGRTVPPFQACEVLLPTGAQDKKDKSQELRVHFRRIN